MAMLLNAIKQKLKDFLTYNAVNPVNALTTEAIYQGIFDNQCRNLGIRNDFFPVGAAASYSLMYLLFRLLTEHAVSTIVELGSGQTTLLIDRIRQQETRHVCYEQDRLWHDHLGRILQRCDYRLRSMAGGYRDGIEFQWYEDVELCDFELLLVDGPIGVDRFSRFGCIDLIAANRSPDFVIVFDDSARPGERDTISHVRKVLDGSGVDYKLNELIGRAEQTIITAGRFRPVSYYY
jgi:hypothetical protein